MERDDFMQAIKAVFDGVKESNIYHTIARAEETAKAEQSTQPKTQGQTVLR